MKINRRHHLPKNHTEQRKIKELEDNLYTKNKNKNDRKNKTKQTK